jgi:hypothetical protein
MRQTVALSKKSPNTESDRRILCLHVNITSQIQVIRLTDSPSLYFERVAFPGQRLLFEATAEAKLEIKTSEAVSILIPCAQLCVTEFFKNE